MTVISKMKSTAD